MDTNSFNPIIEMNLLVEPSLIGSKIDECSVEQRVHIDGCKWMMQVHGEYGMEEGIFLEVGTWQLEY
jgi:hypothetical protein